MRKPRLQALDAFVNFFLCSCRTQRTGERMAASPHSNIAPLEDFSEDAEN
jgi:hypothetical protein